MLLSSAIYRAWKRWMSFSFQITNTTAADKPMLTLTSVHIKLDTLALFASLLAAGAGNADHAKWHVAMKLKSMLELLYYEICFCSFKEKKGHFPNERKWRMSSFIFYSVFSVSAALWPNMIYNFIFGNLNIMFVCKTHTYKRRCSHLHTPTHSMAHTLKWKSPF